MDSTLTIRIDNEIKQKAAANAKALGLDLSAVTRMLLTQLAAKAELPEGLARPNAETLAAVADLERNGGTRYETVEDLMRDLGW
ncbi:type II toxin-antitoxin system RelB/DinJ family antitoxin [Neisseria sp. 23W00296]|uniref:type II toxin-antitoxin system RelB/DinJ family antitoxin n=1 Tax=unclassified Neisseria TaxID=2623750 RepID=UPI003757B64A